MHTIHYNRPKVQRYIIRILLVCPVYAVSSWLSLTVPKYALQTETIRDIYEAFVIYSFLALVLEYSGGEANCVSEITSEEPIPYMWPLRRWLKPRPRDGRLIRFSKQGCLQFVFVKPAMAAISLVMEGLGLYWHPAYQWVLLVIYNLSYTMALYCLALFYTATKKVLKPYRPVVKFAAVKSVVFATYWQSLAVAAMPGLSQEEGQRWNNLVLCVEMVPFALILSLAFGHKDYAPNTRFPDARVLDNIKDVISVKDIVDDTYHNFMPTYREYVLQSAGQPGRNSKRRRKRKKHSKGGEEESKGSLEGSLELPSPDRPFREADEKKTQDKGKDQQQNLQETTRNTEKVKDACDSEVKTGDEKKGGDEVPPVITAKQNSGDDDAASTISTLSEDSRQLSDFDSPKPWRPNKVVRLRTFLVGNLETPQKNPGAMSIKRLASRDKKAATDKLSLLKTSRPAKSKGNDEEFPHDEDDDKLDLETLPGVMATSEDAIPERVEEEKSGGNDAEKGMPSSPEKRNANNL